MGVGIAIKMGRTSVVSYKMHHFTTVPQMVKRTGIPEPLGDCEADSDGERDGDREAEVDGEMDGEAAR